MLRNPAPSLLQHIRRLASTASSDEQLLADFLAQRSDEAFSALIGRHGPMVLNVCRRILHDVHAAEDVFQATFLVLADRAAAVRRPASLAGFLHGIAYRLAVRARKRRVQDLPASLCDKAVGPAEEISWKEMLGILDHELNQISDRYRAPLVLCYLEGRTQDEAARQLDWSLNTLRRRLVQGRRLLEARLRGRGVTLPAALAGLLAASAITVPANLLAATLASTKARAICGVTALPSTRNGLPLFFSIASRKVGVLIAVVALASAICFGYCLTPHTDQAPASEATATPPAASAERDDVVADPLPAQGTVRLGTARYRHGSRIESMAVSADGRLAAVSSGSDSFSPARVFDLTDGRCLYSLSHAGKWHVEAVGLSPDGKILATRDDEYLCFRDAVTGKNIRKFKYMPDSGGGRSVTDWLTFTPDGKQIATILVGNAICLFDVETGKETRTFENGPFAACAFSPDGKLMAAVGHGRTDGYYVAGIWDVGTGKIVHRFEFGNGSIQSLAFSPDGAMLVCGGWADPSGQKTNSRLRLWEVATGKELKVFPSIGKEIRSVAFTPDGKTIAAASDSIHIYDVSTGKEQRRIERRAMGLAFNRDGSILTGAVSGAIYRWDVASGRQLTPATAQDSGVEQIVVTADGKRLFTIDQEGNLYAWDTTSGKPPRQIVSGVERGVVASPDGRFLTWAAKDIYGGSQIRLYDIVVERFIDRFPVFADDASVEAVLPGNKTLLSLDRDAMTARLWDIGSGKEQRSFSVHTENEAKHRFGRHPYSNRRVAISPDGKTLVVGAMDSDQPVGLWDVATGKAGHKLDVRMTSVHAAADAADLVDHLGGRRLIGYMNSGNGITFSPDGLLIVTWSENPFTRSTTDHIAVWDAATGRGIAKLMTDRPIGAGSAAFSPDGRTLATASVDGLIRLWEVATWKVRAEFRGHRDQITALAFGPDGRLFTGGLDTTVLGWDVQPQRNPSKGTLADAWEALTDADGKVGFQAQGRFLAEPAKAVEWFAKRVSPASHPDPVRVKALIVDLGDDDFATRERATAALKECGPVVAAALREVIMKTTSTEARRRAENLLRDIEKGIIPPHELRALRAVEILEWIATPEACACLLELAKGAPDARLTHSVSAACKRLESRK